MTRVSIYKIIPRAREHWFPELYQHILINISIKTKSYFFFKWRVNPNKKYFETIENQLLKACPIFFFKVSVEFEGTSHRYGMIATEDIKKGETLFKIPRKLLLEPTQGSLSRELKEYDHWLRSIGRRYLSQYEYCLFSD